MEVAIRVANSSQEYELAIYMVDYVSPVQQSMTLTPIGQFPSAD